MPDILTNNSSMFITSAMFCPIFTSFKNEKSSVIKNRELFVISAQWEWNNKSFILVLPSQDEAHATHPLIVFVPAIASLLFGGISGIFWKNTTIKHYRTTHTLLYHEMLLLFALKPKLWKHKNRWMACFIASPAWVNVVVIALLEKGHVFGPLVFSSQNAL